MSPIHLSGAALLAAVLLGTAFGAPPPAVRKDDPEVKKLLTQRRELLRELVKGRCQLFEMGRIPAENVLDAVRKQKEVELELADTQASRIAALEDILRIAAKVDAVAQDRCDQGRMALAGLMEVRDFRLECEINLRRGGGKRPKDVPAAAEIVIPNGGPPKGKP
jgi:hypothetical protein